MKKVMSLMVCVLVLMFSSIVFATTTFTATLQGDKNILRAGDEVTVVLKLENFTANENGINILLGTLNYDKSIFEDVEQEDITTIQYWDTPTFNPVNGKILLDASTYISENHNAVKVKLKVKPNVVETKTTEVKLKDIVASDGTSDIAVDEAIITLQIQKSNAVTTSNNSEDSKITYTVIIILAIVIIGSIIIVALKKKKA